MIRILFLLLILVGALYLVRWFLKTPAETVAATVKKSAWFVVGIALIALAASGRSVGANTRHGARSSVRAASTMLTGSIATTTASRAATMPMMLA